MNSLLIADDNIADIDTLCEMVYSIDPNILVFYEMTGEAVLKTAGSGRIPRPSLIFVNTGMRMVSGESLSAALKARADLADIQIVICRAPNDLTANLKMRDRDPVEIIKPFTLMNVRTIIEETLLKARQLQRA